MKVDSQQPSKDLPGFEFTWHSPPNSERIASTKRHSVNTTTRFEKSQRCEIQFKEEVLAVVVSEGSSGEGCER